MSGMSVLSPDGAVAVAVAAVRASPVADCTTPSPPPMQISSDGNCDSKCSSRPRRSSRVRRNVVSTNYSHNDKNDNIKRTGRVANISRKRSNRDWYITDFPIPWNQHYIDIGHCRINKCTARLRTSASDQDIDNMPTSLVAMAIDATSAYRPKERQDDLIVRYIQAFIDRRHQNDDANNYSASRRRRRRRPISSSENDDNNDHKNKKKKTVRAAGGLAEAATGATADPSIVNDTSTSIPSVVDVSVMIDINDSYRNKNAVALAAYHGYTRTLKLLLDIGCPLHSGNGKYDTSTTTTTTTGCAGGNGDSGGAVTADDHGLGYTGVALLPPGDRIDSNTDSHALVHAVRNFQTECIQVLINERRDEIEERLRSESMRSWNQCNTIIDIALRCGNVDAIRLLIPLGGMSRIQNPRSRSNLYKVLKTLYPDFATIPTSSKNTKANRPTTNRDDAPALEMEVERRRSTSPASDDEKRKDFSHQSIYNWCPELHWSFPGPDRWMINWFWHTMTSTRKNEDMTDIHQNQHQRQQGQGRCQERSIARTIVLPNDVCLRVLSFISREWWTK